MSKNKVPPFFEYIKDINQNVKSYYGSEQLPASGFNRFMVLRGMMVSEDTMLIANRVNKMTHIPDHIAQKFLHTMVRPKSPRYGKFPKQKKKSENDELISLLSKEYEISSKTAETALELLEI